MSIFSNGVTFEEAVIGIGLNNDIKEHLPFLAEEAKKASFIVELGVYRGEGSTVGLAHGLNQSDKPDKLMISIDQYDRMQFKPMLPYWHQLVADSMDSSTIKKVIEISNNREPDIIYIDTTHTYEQLNIELTLWNSIAGEDTKFIFHDVWWEGFHPMNRAIMELACKKHWGFEIITKSSSGIGILYNPFMDEDSNQPIIKNKGH